MLTRYTPFDAQVGKPVSGKIADCIGRAEAWMLAILLYTVGYIVLAACNDIDTYAAGWIIRSAGYAAVQILMQVRRVASFRAL